MILPEWMKKNRWSKTALAKALGITKPTLTRYMEGKTDMNLKTAMKIVEISEGKLEFKDLI